MDEGVRLLFERALDGEPAVPTGEMAREARVAGGRLRRRRGLAVGAAAAGVVAVLAGAMAVAATPQPPDDMTPPVPWPVAMMMPDPACTFPAAGNATDAAIFLRVDITDRQRRELEAMLRAEHRLRRVRFESRQQAYARFKRIYADAPDLVGAVKVDQVPESFLVTLAEPSAYARFLTQFSKAGGVDEIVGYGCPDGLPRGAGR